MIKAILFDLDNTLLLNPTRGFVVEYLRLADIFFQQQWGYEHISDVLINSMKRLRLQEAQSQANFTILTEAIEVATGQPRQTILNTWEAFFEQVYPTLQGCTRPVMGASQIVQYFIEAEYTVVIATNPIYPAVAVQKRLQWAGLPNQLSHYALMTHAENMHTLKPDPAYYAEVIARVGVEPDEAIMVGDDLTNDIIPASNLGLSTFHITDAPTAHHPGGTLKQFYHWASQPDWSNTVVPKPLSAEMIKPQYQGNIGALYGMLAGMKDQFWHQHPDPDEWSPIQIVRHLYESERTVQRPRLQQILSEDNPFLVAPKSPPGPEQFPCKADGMYYAQRFTVERLKTIDFLASIQAQDWMRPARHSIFGPTNLLEMAHFTAQHDRLHLNQLCQTLGKCN